MSESVVLFLVAVQIVLLCCCIFVLKSYCGLPFQICKLHEKIHSIYLNFLFRGLTVRRLCRSLLSDSNSGDSQQQMGEAPSTHSAPSASPAPPSYHHQPIPSVIAHTAMPYPVQLDQHLILPPYPNAIYPHEMGFVMPPPLPHSANLETIVTGAESHKIATPRK